MVDQTHLLNADVCARRVIMAQSDQSVGGAIPHAGRPNVRNCEPNARFLTAASTPASALRCGISIENFSEKCGPMQSDAMHLRVASSLSRSPSFRGREAS